MNYKIIMEQMISREDVKIYLGDRRNVPRKELEKYYRDVKNIKKINTFLTHQFEITISN